METVIKRLQIFDFDGTIAQSPEPQEGKILWEKYYGKPFPYSGWWGRPESLDLNVFDIKPFPAVLSQLKKEMVTPNTYVIILTSRVEKLRPQVQAVLDVNNIRVHKLDMKRTVDDKGMKLLKYVQELPNLKVIGVYDDRDSDIASYEAIRNQLPNGVEFNIYVANKGSLSLTESSKKFNSLEIELRRLDELIKEEIRKFKPELDYIYHGTYDGAAYSIQRDGRMKLNAAGNNEQYISFTSKPNVATYYAIMKGGEERGVILRTKMTNDFQISPKFRKKDMGFEWITTKEIPASELEILTKFGWIPINNWDFIGK